MKANPKATQEEIAAYRSSLLTGMLPGPASEAAKLQADDAQEFRDTATSDYTMVNSKLSETERMLNQLLKDPDDTVTAVTTPFPTTGQYGAWDPLLARRPEIRAVLISKLKASLTGDSLSNVKNVRNRTEFETLGRWRSPASMQPIPRNRLYNL